MTVSYQYDVASSTSGGFTRLLFKWRGSVYKLVYRELLLFSVCYAALSVLYRIFLNEAQKRIFELCVAYCATFTSFIPLSFVLGFYVTFVAARWWNQYLAIPWPDKLMHAIGLYIGASDDTSRMIRRTLMRYSNLTLVLVLRSISMAVKKRFPTKEHLIEAGYMTKAEVDMIRSVPSVAEYNTYWIPCTWFVNLLRDAKRNHQVTDNQGIKLIMEELNDFRAKCGMLWSYDWVSIPLVYTQVVTLATYSFFAVSVVGRQYVKGSMEGTPTTTLPGQTAIDCYVPIFTVLQFLFYMGLLKVAEQLINPFGDDDEDFELNWIIDRHITVSYLGVDLLNGQPPPLVKDQYFHDADIQLPYTEAAVAYKRKTYRGSVHTMQVPQEQQHLVLPDITEEEDEDVIAESFNMGSRRASVWTIIGGKINAKFSSSSSIMDEQANMAGTQTSGDNVSEAGSRRISYNSLFVDNRNFKTASTEGIRGRSSPYLAESCETFSPHLPLDDADSIGSDISLQSMEFPETKISTFNTITPPTNSRSSKDSGRTPMFYKSATTLHPGPNLGSGISPAISCTKLKGLKIPKKDLWRSIKVSRNLSWGRKPLSRPWISIAGRNEKPVVKKRSSVLPESEDDSISITNFENPESKGYVSITVECPSDPNIADDCEETTENGEKPNSTNKPEEEMPQKTNRDGTMIKQQSLDETSKSRQSENDGVKKTRFYRSLPALEHAQNKNKSAGFQEPEKCVRWSSDTIQTQNSGNGFRKLKSGKKEEERKTPSLASSSSFSKDKKTLEKKPSLKRQDSIRNPSKPRQFNRHSSDPSSPSRAKLNNQTVVTFKDDEHF